MRPLLIAHRGGKGKGVENTKEAFLNAIEEGYDGVECDIQPTKDGKLVVFHDLDTLRLTGEKFIISDTPYEILQNLTLSKKDDVTHTGKILLFDDFLFLMENTKMKLLIEIKETCSYQDLKKAYQLLKKHHIDDSLIVFISNYVKLPLLFKLKCDDSLKHLECQFVARTSYLDYIDDCIKYGICFDAASSIYESDNLEMFKLFKKHNLKTNVWVVNTIEELKKYTSIGVDYITTDSIRKENL